MGQKVNPHGLRVGGIKNWDSRWFVNDKDFGDTLVEDLKNSFTPQAFRRLKLNVTLQE